MKTAFNILLFILGALATLASASASVELQEFKKLTQFFQAEYGPELKAQNAVIIINNTAPGADPEMWWKIETPHASYSSYTDPNTGVKIHYLFLFGGYARMSGMTIEGVASALCHELGHGIGGAPYKDKIEKYLVSTEGQADYFAARFCLKRMLKYLPAKKPVTPVDGYVDLKCRAFNKTEKEVQLCFRGFETLEAERLFLKNQEENGSDTFYDRPDQSIASKIDTTPTFYPSNQCRLDTMVNGVLNLERPRCWFKP